MPSILQGNLNRSRVADALLDQICLEKSADIALISEQYQYRDRDGSSWYADDLGTAAIWVPNPRRLHVAAHGSGNGFVWVRCRDITYVSCYLTPNESIADFQAKLDGLEDLLRDMGGELIVAGDFNAKALEWGESRPDSRGGRVMDMVSRIGLVVLNTGSASTFRRPGYRETTIDVSLATERLAARVQDWRVIEDYTASDHQYITFRVRDVAPVRAPQPQRGPPRWNVAKMDVERLSLAITRGQQAQGTMEELPPRRLAEAVVDATMRRIHRACGEAMPRVSSRHTRRPVYWWTDEIAELRSKCLRLRRLAMRARRRDHDAAQPAADHKAAKKELRRAIEASKRRCWGSLCDDLNRDPWGLGYKIVLRKLSAFSKSAPSDAETIERIVSVLFPTHPSRPACPFMAAVPGIPLFTGEELSSALRSMKRRKAPGPDGIPAEALKAIGERHPELLLNMYNACLKAGVFPSRWKVARLVLIGKGKGPADVPSSYRPLSMLDTAGKLLEKLLRPRLHAAIQAAGDLSERQYGFRRGRSTVDAIQEVVRAARGTERGNHFSRPVCLLVTLDVRNAFNSVRWIDALDALERDFRVPEYLLRILSDYLRDRSIVYATEDGPRRRELTAGAAQGSILGPDLWNTTYDGILRLEMPEGSTLVGYADDVAAIIIARDVEAAQMRLNQVMRRVRSWMSDHGLELALAKTEIVLLTKKRIPLIREMRVSDATVQTQAAIKYLGVMLDSRLTFGEETRRRADKAAAVVTALSRVMANVRGPRPCKRRLLLRTAESIMLYGAEVWADALRYEKYRKRLAGVQRRAALRIASCYRTVSEPAALVVAGVVPIDLLAQERKSVHQARPAGREERRLLAEQARARSLLTYQDRWDRESRGRWTARLIPCLNTWLHRPHGEVDYYLTQMLTGHGLFRAYLHKMGKVADPGCSYCDSRSDSALHTFFECERWRAERDGLQRDLDSAVTPDVIVEVMLRGPDAWAKVATFAKSVLKEKKREEISRERAGRP